MADTNDIRFNKPADRLIEAIKVAHSQLDGVELNAHNIYEVACSIIRKRLGIIETTKGNKK